LYNSLLIVGATQKAQPMQTQTQTTVQAKQYHSRKGKSEAFDVELYYIRPYSLSFYPSALFLSFLFIYSLLPSHRSSYL
jgi:hypothetical protein